MIYAVGGVSGSGKTRLRVQDGFLQRPTCIDIQDFYRRAEQRGYDIGWQDALQQLLDAVNLFFERNRGRHLVVEAFFRPDSEQRAGLEAVAGKWGEQVQYIWLAAPREECQRRVLQTVSDTEQQRNKRLRFIAKAQDHHFWPIPGESPDDVFEKQQQRYGYGAPSRRSGSNRVVGKVGGAFYMGGALRHMGGVSSAYGGDGWVGDQGYQYGAY